VHTRQKAPASARVAAWSATGAWATGIYVLSSMNSTSGLPFPSDGPDKLIHAAAFAVGGAFAALALRAEGLGWRGAALGGLLIGGGYGVLDEVHQAFTPLRTAAVDDAMADLVGACAGALCSAGRPADAALAAWPGREPA
jgi:VanZ family protein